jgi:uncharacterized membrane protein
METFSEHSPATWFLLFLTYSCAGWAMELVVTLLQKGRLTNRGFFIGPICPIYGVGALVGTLAIGHVENLIAIFCVSVVGAALLEYMTSFLMEKIFRVRWWDYSDQPFNINGRICLGALLGFGVAGVLIVRVFNPLLFAAFDSVNPELLDIIALILAFLFVVDVVCSLILIFGFRVTVGTVERDATEEISERVHAIIMEKGRLSRRIAKAFPNYEPKKSTRRKTSHKSARTSRKTSSKSAKTTSKSAKSSSKSTKPRR